MGFVRQQIKNKYVSPWLTFYFLRLSHSESKFAMNRLADTLPTPQRLCQWKVPDYRTGQQVIDDSCQLCNKGKGTLGHILGTCEYSRESGRYTRRHDQILQILSDATTKKLMNPCETHDDLKTSKQGNVSTLLEAFDTNMRPDLVSINEEKQEIVIMELTVPMEKMDFCCHFSFFFFFKALWAESVQQKTGKVHATWSFWGFRYGGFRVIGQ